MKQRIGRSYIETKGLPTEKLLELALREGNYKSPVYRMHKWWARRLGTAVRAALLGLLLSEDTTEEEYWDIYSGSCNPPEFRDVAKCTILDPFMGGGSSLVEAYKLDLNCVGFDIDPMAWFVARQELSLVDPQILEDAFQNISRDVYPKIARFYQTENESGMKRDVVYYFWVRTLTCPHCQETIELHPHYQLRRDRRKSMQVCFCANCHEVREIPASVGVLKCQNCGTLTKVKKGNIDRTSVFCPYCHNTASRSQLLKQQGFHGLKLFAVQYLEPGESGRPIKRFKKADEFDWALFSMAESEFNATKEASLFIQDLLNTCIPSEGREDKRPLNYGFSKYSELFSARQLLCLATILTAILNIKDESAQELLLLAFSDSLASNNMMCYYAFDYDKVTPLFGLHGYNMVTRPVENNVWGTALGRGTFKNCVAKVLKGLHYMRRGVLPEGINRANSIDKDNHSIRTCMNGSSPQEVNKRTNPVVDLHRWSAHQTRLKENSVDLILTDPPYFDNLNYGEMSDFYYAWLRPVLHRRYPEEFKPPNCVRISDRIHGNGDASSIRDFRYGLSRVFVECKRVLSEAGILALTFHHRRREPWLALAEALSEADFRIVQVVPLRSEGRSGFHSAPGNLKWDALIVCRPLDSNHSTILQRESQLNPKDLLEKWRQELARMPGGPSQEDWRSLEFAIDCFTKHRKLNAGHI